MVDAHHRRHHMLCTTHATHNKHQANATSKTSFAHNSENHQSNSTLTHTAQTQSNAKSQTQTTSSSTMNTTTVAIDQAQQQQPKKATSKNKRTKFPVVLYRMLEDAETQGFEDVISWNKNGRCFKIHDRERFLDDVLPQYLRLTAYKSFVRQLNLWGFSVIYGGRKAPDRGSYQHMYFIRGRADLCEQISRTKKAKSAALVISADRSLTLAPSPISVSSDAAEKERTNAKSTGSAQLQVANNSNNSSVISTTTRTADVVSSSTFLETIVRDDIQQTENDSSANRGPRFFDTVSDEPTLFPSLEGIGFASSCSRNNSGSDFSVNDFLDQQIEVLHQEEDTEEEGALLDNIVSSDLVAPANYNDEDCVANIQEFDEAMAYDDALFPIEDDDFMKHIDDSAMMMISSSDLMTVFDQ
mmetsp:Transcript_5250/g.15325  ORF Transcript_5250/g.15325 Transcript_5250/m.15325 type:complete len:413 (+) Transcript_5250:97-1335(+)